MVASAVLGAATGTGLALLVAMTLVVYRYYSSRRYGKDWGDVERFSVPQGWVMNKRSAPGCGSGKKKSASPQASYTVTQKVFNVAKEERTVQPSSQPSLESVAPPLEVTGGLQATVCTTPSLSSHPSIESNISKQSNSLKNLSPECMGRPEPFRRPLSPLLVPQDSTSSIVTTCSLREVPGSPLPLGSLQPALYTKKEGPIVLRNQDNVGRLHISTEYDFDRSDLLVHLFEGEDFVGHDCLVGILLDPPVDSRVRQSTCRSETNPIFDQVFKFPVSHDQLSNHHLIFQPPEDLSEILISLSYLPSAERLTVVLLKAKNLFLPENRDTLDPFVKVCLLANGKRIKKKKTACRKGTVNPVWNEAITFNVSSSFLKTSAVEIVVFDQGSDLIGAPSTVGSVLIAHDSEHWNEMSSTPRKAVAMWHKIR
ncbi:synaptotagmin-10 isoform X2 [Cimex lectularius]|uniref:C2 domain-containing protein n=1 Tax=Cimex lectularius TaxID=79782 RepID=A0A8I6SLY2_CIMLE|nr:synaptotagmin-10 isoform X2 [Cimex lectularius]